MIPHVLDDPQVLKPRAYDTLTPDPQQQNHGCEQLRPFQQRNVNGTIMDKSFGHRLKAIWVDVAQRKERKLAIGISIQSPRKPNQNDLGAAPRFMRKKKRNALTKDVRQKK